MTERSNASTASPREAAAPASPPSSSPSSSSSSSLEEELPTLSQPTLSNLTSSVTTTSSSSKDDGQQHAHDTDALGVAASADASRTRSRTLGATPETTPWYSLAQSSESMTRREGNAVRASRAHSRAADAQFPDELLDFESLDDETLVYQYTAKLGVLLRLLGFLPWLSLVMVRRWYADVVLCSPFDERSSLHFAFKRVVYWVLMVMRWFPLVLLYSVAFVRIIRASYCENLTESEVEARSFGGVLFLFVVAMTCGVVVLYNPRRLIARPIESSRDLLLSLTSHAQLRRSLRHHWQRLRKSGNGFAKVTFYSAAFLTVMFNAQRVITVAKGDLYEDEVAFNYACDREIALVVTPGAYVVLLAYSDFVLILSGPCIVALFLFIVGMYADDTERQNKILARVDLAIRELRKSRSAGKGDGLVRQSTFRLTNVPVRRRQRSAADLLDADVEVIRSISDRRGSDFQLIPLPQGAPQADTLAAPGTAAPTPQIIKASSSSSDHMEVMDQVQLVRKDLEHQLELLTEMGREQLPLGRVAVVTLVLAMACAGQIAVAALVNVVNSADNGTSILFGFCAFATTFACGGYVIAYGGKLWRGVRAVTARVEKSLRLLDRMEQQAASGGNGSDSESDSSDTSESSLSIESDDGMDDDVDDLPSREPAQTSGFSIEISGVRSSSTMSDGLHSAASSGRRVSPRPLSVSIRTHTLFQEDPQRGTLRRTKNIYWGLLRRAVVLTVVVTAFCAFSAQMRVPGCSTIEVQPEVPVPSFELDECSSSVKRNVFLAGALLSTSFVVFGPAIVIFTQRKVSLWSNMDIIVPCALVSIVAMAIKVGNSVTLQSGQLERIPGMVCYFVNVAIVARRLVKPGSTREPVSGKAMWLYVKVFCLYVGILGGTVVFVSEYVLVSDRAQFLLALLGFPAVSIVVRRELNRICKRFDEATNDNWDGAVHMYTVGDLILSLVSRLLLLSVDSFGSQVVTIVIWSLTEIGVRTAGPLLRLAFWFLILEPGPARHAKFEEAERHRKSTFVAKRIYGRMMSELASIPIAVGIVLSFRAILDNIDQDLLDSGPTTGQLVLSLIVQIVFEVVTDLIATVSEHRLLDRPILDCWLDLDERVAVLCVYGMLVGGSTMLVELAALVGNFEQV